MDLKVFGAMMAVMVLWSGVLFWAVKWLLDRYQAHMDQRFAALKQASQDEFKEWQRVEKELLRLQARLPNEYVRREDYIRFISVVDAKLDALGAKITGVELPL